MVPLNYCLLVCYIVLDTGNFAKLYMKAQNVWNCPLAVACASRALLIWLYSAVSLSISVTEWLFKSALVDHAGTHPCPHIGKTFLNEHLTNPINFLRYFCLYLSVFIYSYTHTLLLCNLLCGHPNRSHYGSCLFAVCPVPARVETQNQCEQGMSNWCKGHGKGLDCATLGRRPHNMSAPGWNIFLVLFFVDLWTNLGIDTCLFLMRKSELRLLNCN